MSEETNTNPEEPIEEEVASMPSELDVLKQRAKQVGMKFHHKVGVEKLRNQLEAFLTEKEEPAPIQPAPTAYAPPSPAEVNLGPGIRANETKMQRRKRLRDEAFKLVRVRVTCMNPAMKEYEGQIYSVGNNIVGMVKKYVPFNVDEGWHIPNILYQHLKERKCQVFYTVKGGRGNKIRKGKLINELSIEKLPPLTPKEMADLAHKQALANNQAN